MGMLADVNKLAKKYKLRITRGNGYWYWTSKDNKTQDLLSSLYTTNVDVYAIDHLSLKSWKSELEDIVHQMKDELEDRAEYKKSGEGKNFKMKKEFTMKKSELIQIVKEEI